MHVDLPSYSRMASSDGPEEEFSNGRRKELLNELEQRIGLMVPPSTWALLWLADIDMLEYWVDEHKREKVRGTTRTRLVRFEDSYRLFRQCKCDLLHTCPDESKSVNKM